MAKETIEIQRSFKVGQRNSPPAAQGGNSPWQEFKRDPADWALSTGIITATLFVGLFVIIPVLCWLLAIFE